MIEEMKLANGLEYIDICDIDSDSIYLILIISVFLVNTHLLLK